MLPDDSLILPSVKISAEYPPGGELSTSARATTNDDPSPAAVWAQGCPALPAYYCNQWGLETINAGRAYANLYTLPGSTQPGEGIVLGIVDLGIHNDYGIDGIGVHPAFGDRVIVEKRLPGLGPNPGNGRTDSHGTSVASVAAAVPLDTTGSMQGVAPGATLISYGMYGRSPVQTDHYVGVTRGDLFHFSHGWLAIFDTAVRDNVDILNISLGYTGIIESYSKETLTSGFSSVIRSMAQAESDDKMLIVWAAGNANGKVCLEGDSCVNNRIQADSVEVLPGLVARFEELQGHMAAVVAVGTDGRIASFSNRCGIAKANCIAAPGVGVRIAYFGPWPRYSSFPFLTSHNDYVDGNGTSYAAPMVAGGLALVKQRFRDQLSSEEVLTRLFETANDRGIYSDENIYGHGLMDLGAATDPVGVTAIVIGSTVSANQREPLHTTALTLGSAFGLAPQRQLAGREIAAFDSMGAPFWLDVGTLVSNRNSDIANRLGAMLDQANPATTPSHDRLHLTSSMSPDAGVQFGVLSDSRGFTGLAGHSLAMSLSSVDSPIAATAFTSEGTAAGLPASGLALEWKPLGLSVGMIAERASSLGAVSSGGFGSLSSNTVFAGIGREERAGPWRLAAEAEVGTADPSTSSGMLESLDTTAASRFALSASRKAGRNGLIRLSLEQPLRVESAQATLRAPVGRAKDGGIIFDRWQADLTPNGRQIDLSAWLDVAPRDTGKIRLGAIYSRHPGHDANSAPSLSLLAGYRLAF